MLSKERGQLGEERVILFPLVALSSGALAETAKDDPQRSPAFLHSIVKSLLLRSARILTREITSADRNP